jgi:capsular exopolysaccharide synthesis family protein
MVAFLLPFGLAIGVEFLNRRVSDRHQLESAKGIQVVGEITALPRRQRPRRLGMSSPSHELQLFEESIDGLRTYLTVVDSLREHRSFAVMSAISQEGKSNLAAQLAMSVASATGEQVLLIDGDMRSPDVDEIFGVNRDPGLAGILRGECSAGDAIHKDFSENLHLLPAGTLDTSPHRLLGKGEFGLLLTHLREQYRYIIVDTPPILPASESLVMARATDAAVLCVRRDYSRIEQVAEAYHRLQAAGVKTAGAVINGIPVRSYVYRYGRYDYRGK